MREALRQILGLVETENVEQREEAILQLAMLLEKCSVFHDKKDFYESILDHGLLQIELDESEKEELINHLFSMVKRSQDNSSLVWALGKGDVPTVMSRLIQLFDNHQVLLSGEARRQALTAINRLLSGDTGDPLLLKMKSVAIESDLKSILRDFGHRDTRSRVLAQRIIGKLES